VRRDAYGQTRLDEFFGVKALLRAYTDVDRLVAGYLVDRYSERRESAEALSERVNLRSVRARSSALCALQVIACASLEGIVRSD